LAQQTPPPGTKIIDLVNIVNAQPDPSVADDDLDDLLAELDIPATSPEEAQESANSSVPPAEAENVEAELSIGDNLDSLLNDLAADAEKAEAEPAAMAESEPAQAEAETSAGNDFEDFDHDDLESLIEDLSQKADAPSSPGKGPAAPAKGPAAPAKGLATQANGPAADELADLLAADAPDKLPPEQELLKIETEPPEDQPAFDASELDALLDELGAKSPDQLSPQAGDTGSDLLDSEDLDSLLAEIAPNALSAPTSPKAEPAAPATAEDDEDWPEPASEPAPSPPDKAESLASQVEADSDELDKFLLDLQAAEVIKEVELAPADPTPPPSEPQDELDDDLDSLLADLEGGFTEESEKPAPLPEKSKTEKPAPILDDWDLDLPVSAAEPAGHELIPDKPAPAAAAPPPALPAQGPQTLQVVMNPALEAALLKLTPALTPETAREIYQTVLTEVLGQVIPKLVGQEVARQVNLEIDAIKRLAGID
jgi:hypothetical protein